MKILFAIEEIGGGGKERRLVEHLRDLSKDSDFDIHLVVSKGEFSYAELNNLPITIHWINGASLVSTLRGYLALIKHVGPDIVHAWSFKSSFCFSLLNLFFRYRLVAGFIGDTLGFSWLRLLIAKILVFRVADVIVSNSRAGLYAYRVPVKKGIFVYNGFDFSRVESEKNNKLIGLGIRTRFKVVMLANVTRYKNYSLFIDVAEKITSTRDDVTFISIGEIWPAYQGMVSPYTNGRHPFIKFLGFKEDALDLIAECDIGVLCTYSEGISNAIIELMASGVPVVTNDRTGGSKEIIEHGFDGLIVSDDRLASTIIGLLNDEYSRKRLSDNAVESIRQRFSTQASTSAYCAIYSNVIRS